MRIFRDPQFRRAVMMHGTWRDPRTRRGLLIAVLAAVLLGGFVSFMLGIPHATNPRACGQTCHAVFPEYEAWRRSSHRNVPCHYCHLDKPSDKVINPVRRLIQTRTDSFKKPINADSEVSQTEIPNDRCLRCHAAGGSFAGERIPKPDSGMHVKHIEAGLRCATCHNRVAHLNAERFEPLSSWKPGFKYKDFTSMRDGCWRCHSRNPKYRNEKTLELAGEKVPPTKCTACHKKWQLKPLTGGLSHSARNSVLWKDGGRHGRMAKRDFGPCLSCHPVDEWADNENNLPNCGTSCHRGVALPHNIPKWARYFDRGRPDWLQEHGQAPGEACSLCHDGEEKSRSSCDACHHRQFDKARRPQTLWGVEHRPVVRRVGSLVCQRCHQLDFCVSCHTGAKPAP